MNISRIRKTHILALVIALFEFGCSKASSNAAAGGGISYDISATAKSSIGLKSVNALSVSSHFSKATTLTDGPTLCSSVVCFTPTAMTGKYYGTGLQIQSSGNGMVAYFGQDSWSSIKGTSQTYDFDSAAPVTNSGDLKCCGGTGDLDSENTYVSEVIYLFGYIDATFTLSGITGNTTMNREFTVRFVLADGAITDGIRGDLLIKDPSDGVFKWIDKSVSAGGDVGDGALVSSRPTTPVTMDSSVTKWTNPFGTSAGNQEIPVIYAPILPETLDGKVTISKTQIETSGRTYSYSFDPTNFIMFPSMQTTDLNMLYSYTQLLSKIHLGGLPHSMQTMGVGSPASTVLKITEP